MTTVTSCTQFHPANESSSDPVKKRREKRKNKAQLDDWSCKTQVSNVNTDSLDDI